MLTSRVAFVSGHVDIEHDTFITKYKQNLDNAISSNDKFIMGDADGCDAFALEYLLEATVDPKDITIYYFRGKNSKQYYLDLNVNVKDGYDSYSKRDKQMTNDSDYDIAWVRSTEESKRLYGVKYNPKKKSGTQQNIERRLDKKKQL